MQLATCNWCLRFIKVDGTYNPKTGRRYCSRECLDRDAIFEEYYSDEKIGRRNYEKYGINNAKRRRK